jgi:acyl-coenzyme A synthetase/AMP-(fatty) acid ligase
MTNALNDSVDAMKEAQSVNVAGALVEVARRLPDAPALIEPWGTYRKKPLGERRWTFRQLDAESDRLARGLLRFGLRRGMRTVLMVPPSLEFYALTFALFKLGAVVVFIDPGMGVRNLGVCLGEAEPEAFIGVPKAHLARVVLGWSRKTVRLLVTVGMRLVWGGWTLQRVRREGEAGEPMLADTSADETAAILFTSGSTGVAKGVVYTHGIFAAQVAYLREVYHIDPGEIDLPTFPLFGLFGPALGMTAVIPEMDSTRPAHVDPRRILTAIRHYQVTNLFGSPALLRRVGFDRRAKVYPLPSLRRVISAGAPVPPDVIAQFIKLLGPGVQVHTPYGATEALPVSSIGSASVAP